MFISASNDQTFTQMLEALYGSSAMVAACNKVVDAVNKLAHRRAVYQRWTRDDIRKIFRHLSAVLRHIAGCCTPEHNNVDVCRTITVLLC